MTLLANWAKCHLKKNLGYQFLDPKWVDVKDNGPRAFPLTIFSHSICSCFNCSHRHPSDPKRRRFPTLKGRAICLTILPNRYKANI